MPRKVDDLLKQAGKTLIPELLGMNVLEQGKIDRAILKIDGTSNYSKVGGSVSIAVSLACLKCAAELHKKEVYEYLGPAEKTMPALLGKCIGGGAHSRLPSTDFQEFLSIPLTDSAEQGMLVKRKMHAKVGKALGAKRLDYEGGWTANITAEKALEVMSQMACEVSEATKTEVGIGVDIAASRLWNGSEYVYKDKKLDPERQHNYVQGLIETYGIMYVEDPFHEEDFQSHAKLTKNARDAMICGDDLFATNKERLRMGIKLKACNAVIIKPNQAGTVTQAYETLVLAKNHSYIPVVSHRSGETKDAVLSHLAVGWSAPFMKIGIVGKERVAKTDELVRIEKGRVK
jgi:enolase